MKIKTQPQTIKPKELVESLIRNHYNRIKAAEELGVDIDVFQNPKYLEYVKANTIRISPSDMTQMVIADLNDLDRNDRYYHRNKQKYYEILISLIKDEEGDEEGNVEYTY